MSALLKPSSNITPSDYLAGELTSEVRHEYVDGLVYAMSGASVGHNRMVNRVRRVLTSATGDKHCEVFVLDIKVQIAATNSYYYPDVVLSCEPVADDSYVIDAPCLIVEVTSPTTEATDRREKLRAYQTLPTLKDYWIVNPNEAAVECWQRTPQGWAVQYATTSDSLYVSCLQADITLQSLYAAE